MTFFVATVIFPNSPAAASLPQSELEKRQASFATRRNLLKSNPLLYISKTRLSVRQIPTYVSEKCLKKLAMYAVKAFEEGVKQGKREAISEEEKRRDVDDDAEADGGDLGEDEEEASSSMGKSKKHPKTAKTLVKQAKIVRQSDRVDALTNKLKSKGYGFIEMGKHTDALRVLRWVNNNPGVHVHLEGWWKEELKDMINRLEAEVGKGGKGGKGAEGAEDATDVEARVKRAKAELEKLEAAEKSKGRRGGKAMVVEFSIENSQVVKRRTAVQKERVEVCLFRPCLRSSQNVTHIFLFSVFHLDEQGSGAVATKAVCRRGVNVSLKTSQDRPR